MDTNTPDDHKLDFDQADFDEQPSGPPACTVCDEELYSTYFELNGLPACERCRFKVEEEMGAGTPSGRFFKAMAAGAAAGAVGAGVYYAVLALTGYHVGLVAIVVGWLVGKAVRFGSAARGGWVYQTMAVLLTYLAIVSTFIPQIIGEIRDMDFDEVAMESTVAGDETAEEVIATLPAEDPPAESASAETPEAAFEPMPAGEEIPELSPAVGLIIGLALLVVLAMIAPFLSGSIIGFIIIAVGLYEAWRQNKKLVLTIEGPFQMGTRPPGGFVPADEDPETT